MKAGLWGRIGLALAAGIGVLFALAPRAEGCVRIGHCAPTPIIGFYGTSAYPIDLPVVAR